MRRSTLTLLILAVFLTVTSAQKKEADLAPLTAEAIIAKHIASIGSASDVKAVRSRVMVGTGFFYSSVNPGKVEGPAQFASEGSSMLLALILNANNYPAEKIAYNGDDSSVAMLPGGGYSPLSRFVKSNKLILKAGLFGGVLRTSWPFLNAGSGYSVDSAGTGKIDDRSVYKVKFSTSGIGDMSVVLYFDSETFHHIRTEYFYRVGQLSAPNPNRPAVVQTAPNSFSLTEDFSNFAKADGVALPLTYRVEYSSQSGKPMVWTFNFAQVYNNQQLDPAVFKVS